MIGNNHRFFILISIQLKTNKENSNFLFIKVEKRKKKHQIFFGKWKREILTNDYLHDNEGDQLK